MNYLMSPPLVVAYALAGTMDIDLFNDALGMAKDGRKVYLKDIWPTASEVAHVVDSSIVSDMLAKRPTIAMAASCNTSCVAC